MTPPSFPVAPTTRIIVCSPRAPTDANIVSRTSRSLLRPTSPAPMRPSPTLRLHAAVLACALTFAPAASAQAPARGSGIPTPSQFLGFTVGADRTLADWGQITSYFQRLAAESPAVHLDTLGRSTNGQPFIVAVVSSPANIARLPEIRAVQAKLADPRTLTPDEERRLIATQPSVVFISNNI